MGGDSKGLGGVLRRWPRDPLIGLLAAAICIAITTAGLACSDSDNEVSSSAAGGTTNAVPPAGIITDQDVKGTPKGSPQRTLFQFFQAVQFQDIAAVRPLVTPRALRAVGRPGLEAALAAVGPAVGKPQVFDVRRTGDRATVRLLVLGFQPGRDKPASARPVSFTLARTQAGWRLTDLKYLVTTRDDIAEERERVRNGS